jgi:hypothetical protein
MSQRAPRFAARIPPLGLRRTASNYERLPPGVSLPWRGFRMPGGASGNKMPWESSTYVTSPKRVWSSPNGASARLSLSSATALLQKRWAPEASCVTTRDAVMRG